MTDQQPAHPVHAEPAYKPPVQTILRAAQLLEERAGAATQGPWEAVDCRHQRYGQIRIFGRPAGGLLANVLASGRNAAADASYVEAVHPGVGLGVARMLRQAASDAIEDGHEHFDGPDRCTVDVCRALAALEVARQVLRDQR